MPGSKTAAFYAESMFKRASMSERLIMQGSCPLDANGAVTLLSFLDVAKDRDRGESTVRKFSLAELVADYRGGQYSLLFANCVAEDVSVSFDLRLAMYNMRPDGITKDYLSVGEDMLPTVFMVRLGVSICFFWGGRCVWRGSKGKRIGKRYVWRPSNGKGDGRKATLQT
jgi:hypothetical protein